MAAERHDLSEFASPSVTGAYEAPMTAAERRAANEAYRAREAERTARIDALVEEYELTDGTVVRDAVNVYYRLDATIRNREDFHDAWWLTFGDEGGWRLGEECPHDAQRESSLTPCPIQSCPGRIGGPVLPLTVVSH